jgi:HNH endonuclease
VIEDDRPICRREGCDLPTMRGQGKRFCSDEHRDLNAADVIAAEAERKRRKRPVCRREGCDRPRRAGKGNVYCSEECRARPCEACGAPIAGSGRFCSDACRFPVLSATCIVCAIAFVYPKITTERHVCDDCQGIPELWKPAWERAARRLPCSREGCDRPRLAGSGRRFCSEECAAPRCIECGEPSGTITRRAKCADCRRPTEAAKCRACGDVFEYVRLGPKPRTLCDPCKDARSVAWWSTQPKTSTRPRREVVLERDGWICWLCEEPIQDLPKTEAWTNAYGTADHIRPREWGGEDSYRNVRAAHFGCNRARGSRWDGLSGYGSDEGREAWERLGAEPYELRRSEEASS